jgi:hypothetical protein
MPGFARRSDFLPGEGFSSSELCLNRSFQTIGQAQFDPSAPS